MSEERKGGFRFLVPVQELPEGSRERGFYASVLREFVESGLKYAEVKDVGKRPGNMCVMFKHMMKQKRITNVSVHVWNKKVYLSRTDLSDSSASERDINTSPHRERETRKAPSLDTKPSIDVVTLSSGLIIKLRCPKCKALNAQDASRCRDCGLNFYESEQERHESVRSMEKLEKELNFARR